MPAARKRVTGKGYHAGFVDGRRQDDDGSTVATAAVVNNAGNGAHGTPKARLFGLPCANCGSWFFSDEASCPRCSTPRASTPEAVTT